MNRRNMIPALALGAMLAALAVTACSTTTEGQAVPASTSPQAVFVSPIPETTSNTAAAEVLARERMSTYFAEYSRCAGAPLFGNDVDATACDHASAALAGLPTGCLDGAVKPSPTTADVQKCAAALIESGAVK